jgi:hypothetical protein
MTFTRAVFFLDQLASPWPTGAELIPILAANRPRKSENSSVQKTSGQLGLLGHLKRNSLHEKDLQLVHQVGQTNQLGQLG